MNVTTCIFTNGCDLHELSRHINSNSVDRFTLKRFVSMTFRSCSCREKLKHHGRLEKCSVDDGKSEKCDKRACSGHERVLPKEKTVNDLDMREESLETLLCYLELHREGWLKNLPPTYNHCHMQCYGGAQQLHDIAKRCPAVAATIALLKREGKFKCDDASLQFDPVSVADVMGWSSESMKRDLRQLPFIQDSQDKSWRKTGVIVEFSELCFHFRAPGDLDCDELDAVLDYLHSRVVGREMMEKNQLQIIFSALSEAADKHHWMVDAADDSKGNKLLKNSIHDYFNSSSRNDLIHDSTHLKSEVDESRRQRLVTDVSSFCNIYSDQPLTGRVIARIFHGIGSPCYPAQVWGRVRRFWRSHLDLDFNLIIDVATKELVWRASN